MVPVINRNTTESIKLRYIMMVYTEGLIYWFFFLKANEMMGPSEGNEPKNALLQNLFSFTGISNCFGLLTSCNNEAYFTPGT